MIDPSKEYRTRDGRPVRIYATDGQGGYQVHGAVYSHGWKPEQWDMNGHCKHFANGDLIEATLADELREQIPWNALRDEIRWVAWSPHWQTWRGYTMEPHDNLRGWTLPPGSGDTFSLSGVAMPEVAPGLWRDTLVQRPEDA